jgi:hypothetical protein
MHRGVTFHKRQKVAALIKCAELPIQLMAVIVSGAIRYEQTP